MFVGSGCFHLINFSAAKADAQIISDALPLPVSFSVDANAQGLNDPLPNDVFGLGPLGANLPTEGEIFQSSGNFLTAPPNDPLIPDGTNKVRLDAALGIGIGSLPMTPQPNPMGGSFGLMSGDNIISLSYGLDSGNILQFSVNPDAMGSVGSGVRFQANPDPTNVFEGNEAAGDIFKGQQVPPFGSYILEHSTQLLEPAPLSNQLYRDERELGLQAPAISTIPGDEEDDLDALEEADTGDEFWGVDANLDGIVDQEKFAFFSLDNQSSSLSLGTDFSTDDILVSTEGSFDLYADGISNIGLLDGDVLDALALSDVGGLDSNGNTRPNGLLDLREDEALFSLADDSPTLLLTNPDPNALPSFQNLSPGDVFYTDFDRPFDPFTSVAEGGSLHAKHFRLGLEINDELNALDIKPIDLDNGGGSGGGGNGKKIPEPSSALGLIVLSTLSAGSLLKRKLKHKPVKKQEVETA